MQYQGHLNDGSSIQAHSAGGLYPYVIYAQGADALTYGVIVPGQSGVLIGTYDEAVATASALKNARLVPPADLSHLRYWVAGWFLLSHATVNSMSTDEVLLKYRAIPRFN